jgi:hypothetical protein
MQSSSRVKSKARDLALLNFRYCHWIPVVILFLVAMPRISSARVPTGVPPPGTGPEIRKANSGPHAKAPRTPHQLPPRSAVPPGAGSSIPPHAQVPQARTAPPVSSYHVPPPATQAVPAPTPAPTITAPVALPMDQLPANPLPNATALKPIPPPAAAVAPTSKTTPAQAVVAPTVPITANVQSPSVDTSGLDPRSGSQSNVGSVLTPGQLTTKLTPLPGNLPTSDLTSRRFNYETKSQAPCTQISTQAHTLRRDTALVDLTSDGLIVSALPNAQLRNSLQMAGYTQIVLNRPASWCLPAAAMSALLRSPAAGAQRSITMPQQKLVQVKGQWQLVQAPTAVNRRSAVNSKSSSNLQVQGQALKIAQRTG